MLSVFNPTVRKRRMELVEELVGRKRARNSQSPTLFMSPTGEATVFEPPRPAISRNIGREPFSVRLPMGSVPFGWVFGRGTNPIQARQAAKKAYLRNLKKLQNKLTNFNALHRDNRHAPSVLANRKKITNAMASLKYNTNNRPSTMRSIGRTIGSVRAYVKESAERAYSRIQRFLHKNIARVTEDEVLAEIDRVKTLLKTSNKQKWLPVLKSLRELLAKLRAQKMAKRLT